MYFIDRITEYYSIANKIKSLKYKCSEFDKYLSPNGDLGAGYGGIVKKYIIKDKNPLTLAIKQMRTDTGNPNEIKSEIESLKKCTELVLSKNALNLPILYDVCQAKPKGKDTSIYLFLEYYDITMKQWCESPHTFDEWIIAYFQIFCGLYTLEKYTDIFLQDIKFDNIMIKKIPKQNIYYIIDGKEYIIPNCEYIFILIDFGLTTKKKNNKYFVNTLDNSAIRIMNIDKYSHIYRRNFMKKSFRETYDKIETNARKNYANGKIKLWLDDKLANEKETIRHNINNEIDTFITGDDEIYQKFMKGKAGKYKEQPADVVDITYKFILVRDGIQFDRLLPKLYYQLMQRANKYII